MNRKDDIPNFPHLRDILMQEVFKERPEFVKSSVLDFMRNLTQETDLTLLEVMQILECISHRKNYDDEEISDLSLTETLELVQDIFRGRDKTFEAVHSLLVALLNMPSHLRLDRGYELMTLTQNRLGDANSVLHLLDLEMEKQAEHLSVSLHQLSDHRKGNTDEVCELLDELSHARVQKTASGGRRASLTSTTNDFLEEFEKDKGRLPLGSLVEVMRKVGNSLNQGQVIDREAIEGALAHTQK